MEAGGRRSTKSLLATELGTTLTLALRFPKADSPKWLLYWVDSEHLGQGRLFEGVSFSGMCEPII